jgi:ABC-type thiamine transport system ATPase subunit
MLKLIQDLKDERDVAVLMVTHQPEDAEDADAIAFLDNGRIESVMSNTVFREGPYSRALQQYLGQ